jgi:integrase
MNHVQHPVSGTPIGSMISLSPIKTFDEAAASYIENGGDNRYLPRIVEYLTGRPLAAIFPFDLRQMAMDLYPAASNATRNRQALTPARSVIIHGYDRGWCNLIRIRKLKEDPPKRKKPASPTWLHAFTRQCAIDELPHVAAIVLFMAQTGARVSEAVALRWQEVDLAGRRALLLKTKTNVNSTRHLTDELVTRLHALQIGREPGYRVFRYGCRYSVNERIRAVCQRAGISYKSSHACGRHSFATNAIDNGIDIKTAMHAGDWRSVEVFLGTYVTPRQNAGRMVADQFNAYSYEADL